MNYAFFTWQNILIIGVVAFIATWLMSKFEHKAQGAI